jgi:hypothetical protein
VDVRPEGNKQIKRGGLDRRAILRILARQS